MIVVREASAVLHLVPKLEPVQVGGVGASSAKKRGRSRPAASVSVTAPSSTLSNRETLEHSCSAFKAQAALGRKRYAVLQETCSVQQQSLVDTCNGLLFRQGSCLNLRKGETSLMASSALCSDLDKMPLSAQGVLAVAYSQNVSVHEVSYAVRVSLHDDDGDDDDGD